MAYDILNQTVTGMIALAPSSERNSSLNATGGNDTVVEFILPNRTDVPTYQDQDTEQALLYIVAVLMFYAFSLTLLMIKYIKGEREDQKLSYYYQAFVKRDDFLQAARKASVMQMARKKTSAVTYV